MTRVREVSKKSDGRVHIEFRDGTGRSLKKLPETEAIQLARELDERLDIYQKALSEVESS